MKLNLQNLKFDEFCLAIDSSTPLETLDRLANDKSSTVRVGVALNLNIPPEILERLANDEDSWVRANVARNPNTIQYIKDYLKICKFIEYYEVPNC